MSLTIKKLQAIKKIPTVGGDNYGLWKKKNQVTRMIRNSQNCNIQSQIYPNLIGIGFIKNKIK